MIWRVIQICRGALLAAAVVLGLAALFTTTGRSARAEPPQPGTLAEINHAAMDAAYYSGKANQHTQQIRDLLVVAIVLIVGGMGTALYLLVRRVGAGFVEDAALRGLQKRQTEIARAVVSLQAFADQSVRSQEDLSALLAEIAAKMKRLDQDIREASASP